MRPHAGHVSTLGLSALYTIRELKSMSSLILWISIENEKENEFQQDNLSVFGLLWFQLHFLSLEQWSWGKEGGDDIFNNDHYSETST